MFNFEKYLLEIAAFAVIHLLMYWWCMCRRHRQFATHSPIAAEQESSTGEPSELVISNLQSLQAAGGESHIRVATMPLQVPVAETNYRAVSELVL